MRKGHGAEYFFKDVAGQSGADCRKRGSDRDRVPRAERSVFKQPAGNRLGEQRKRRSGRKCKPERDFISTRLSRGERAIVSGGRT